MDETQPNEEANNALNLSDINAKAPFVPKAKDFEEQKVEESVDKFAIELDTESLIAEVARNPSWSKLSNKQRTINASRLILKLAVVVSLLYFFICSLTLLPAGFRILGGPQPHKLFEEPSLQNPVVRLMCGVIFTIFVQSSSTTSSAVVGLVAGKIISVEAAIPIIMGANIGTSLTNTILAMMQVGDRDRFRRAFAAATIHDMFNWLTTIVLLPVECLTGYLFYVTREIVWEIEEIDKRKGSNIELIKALTDPLTNKIVKLNDTVIAFWTHKNHTIREMMKTQPVLERKGHLFAGTGWSEKTVGAIIISISFISVLTCLFFMGEILKSILKGKLAIWIRRTSNTNLPHCPSMTEYLLILMGAFLTILVQSSSVFTSTLPPLVSVKAVSIERAYCLTLGANLGTTTTSLIAAMAQTENFSEGLQIALCHLFFNLTGVILFFPFSCTRFPVQMAKALGNTTARYRWFAMVYVLILFILLPLLFMGLAFAGAIYVIAVACILIFTFLFVVTVNSLRIYPRFLPECLHTWSCLPIWLRSLEPYDSIFSTCACCSRLISLEKSGNTESGAADMSQISSVKVEDTAAQSLKAEVQKGGGEGDEKGQKSRQEDEKQVPLKDQKR